MTLIETNKGWIYVKEIYNTELEAYQSMLEGNWWEYVNHDAFSDADFDVKQSNEDFKRDIRQAKNGKYYLQYQVEAA